MYAGPLSEARNSCISLASCLFVKNLATFPSPLDIGLATTPKPKALKKAPPPYITPSTLRLSSNACLESIPKVAVPIAGLNSARSTDFSALVYLYGSSSKAFM